MIINNNALMDENLFNFQLEMADLQLYHDIQTNALEITTESDNIFIKIKNAIVNFFKKVVDWIKGFFKKEVKETSTKNTENKNLAKNVDKNKEFPITVSGGDNIFYNLSSKDFRDITVDSFNFNSIIDELQTFRDFASNAQTRTKEQLMHFIQNFSDGVDITGPNFTDIVNANKKELEDIKNDITESLQNEDIKIKLTPGGKINSQQELDKIIKQCGDNKELEKLLSELEKNNDTLEKICSDIENKIRRLSLDDKEIIKMLNNLFTLTNISVNGYIGIINIVKNIAKKNISVFNSLLKQLQ